MSADDAAALAGRSIQINGFDYSIVSAASGDAGSATITIQETPDESIVDGSLIYPAGAGAEGRDIYSTLFIGQNAYGVTNITGGGLETILKQKGSAGTGDPLDQRALSAGKRHRRRKYSRPNFW